jgi:hypothetical protein
MLRLTRGKHTFERMALSRGVDMFPLMGIVLKCSSERKC